MDLTQLKYFITTANCGKVVDASELLHVSQSTISMSMKKLEEELGVALFEKQGRNIVLTEHGARFRDMILPAISQLDFAEEQMHHVHATQPNTISLSIEMPDFATFLENEYTKKYPDVIFHQAMDTYENSHHKLATASVDFAISFVPVRHPDIISVHILTEPAYIQVSELHPFFNRSSLSLNEFRDMSFVSFSDEYSFKRWADDLCFLCGFRPKIHFEVCDTQSLARIVAASQAATFIGESTAVWNKYLSELYTQIYNIRTIPLKEEHCVRHIYLQYNKNRILSEEAKRFLEYTMRFKDAYAKIGNVVTAAESI